VIVDQATQLIFNRADRVSRASGSLNGMTTLICIILALLTVLSMALLPAPSRRWVKWVQAFGVATAVGLVMALVFYISSDAYSQEVEHEQIDLLEQLFEKSAPK
jgi:predicted exporter